MSNRAILNTELPTAVHKCFVVVAGWQPAAAKPTTNIKHLQTAYGSAVFKIAQLLIYYDTIMMA